MSSLLDRLKERKVVRWALAYVAGAWVVLEGTASLGDLFGVPLGLQRGVAVVLAFGLVVTVVVAWFHGERGPQRVTTRELLVLGAILVLAGVSLRWVRARTPADGGTSPTGEAATLGPPTPDPLSVAILPFRDLSPDRDQQYFSDGIAEELRSALARVEGLRVASGTSSAALAGVSLDPAQIGVRLGVAHLVEGSVRKSGGRLRIDARMVTAADGFQIWTESYDAGAEDIFAVQDSIARSVARAFEVRFTESPGAVVPRGQTADHVAQDLYLRGRFAWNLRTREGLERAVEHFRDAVARDPTYARALAGLGDAYAVLGFYDYRPPSEAFPLAQDAARRALALDSALAEPHATLGYAALYHDWDWAAAEGHFLRSIALDPGYPVAHQWYANFLTARGRFDEAVAEMRTASELDPLAMISFAAIGWVQWYARRYDEALAQLEAAESRDPRFELAFLWGGQVHESRGDLEAAESRIRRALELSGGNALSRTALARVLGLAGRRDEALALLRDLESEGRAGYVPSYEMARAWVGVGDVERALESLERAVRERSHSVVFLGVDPQFDPIRDEPGFQELVARIGAGA